MIRSALRAVGYVVSELIPAQAIRCCLDRDYADAMYDAAAKHDGAEQLTDIEAEQEVHEPQMPCERFAGFCRHCGSDYGQECRRDRVHVDSHDDGPIISDPDLRYNLIQDLIKPPAASAEAAGSPEAVSSPPREPASGHLTVDWLTPAICEVLSEHIPEGDADGAWHDVRCYNPHAIETLHKVCHDWQEWREHVAPLIAEHILNALEAQPK